MKELNNYLSKKILTACIGQCVHVAGIHNFINIAQRDHNLQKKLDEIERIKDIIVKYPDKFSNETKFIDSSLTEKVMEK